MTTSVVAIERVSGLFGMLAFHNSPRAFRTEPQYTPDISLDFLRQTSAKNPFFKHAAAAFFIAKRGRTPVGRVAACVDHAANQYHHEIVVNFGYFEIADRESGETTKALLDACAEFGRKHNATILRGPIDLNMNHRIGLLVENFDAPPAIMLPWNPPSYPEALERYGLLKAKDLFSMEVTKETISVERYKKIAERAKERGGFTVRSFDFNKMESEMSDVHRLFNSAWEGTWGFTPISREEFNYLAKSLRHVLNPRLGCFIEKDGRAIAFSLSIPDVAIAIREVRGRLLPFGWLHLMRRIKNLRRSRMILLGIDAEYRKTGADALLYYSTAERGAAAGFTWAEFGWMLENNLNIIRGCEACGAKITKRFRIYEKQI
ncbi:MAG: hypothetical protein ACKVS6_13110 [Planctomycetota bacterium]